MGECILARNASGGGGGEKVLQEPTLTGSGESLYLRDIDESALTVGVYMCRVDYNRVDVPDHRYRGEFVFACVKDGMLYGGQINCALYCISPTSGINYVNGIVGTFMPASQNGFIQISFGASYSNVAGSQGLTVNKCELVQLM